VLAYAALDLGDSKAALTHAEAAWVCAERAQDNELRAWVRGTQSLIARFDGDYDQAMSYVLDGLRYGTPGTGKLRLLCGYAQCHANLGDSHGTNHALDLALVERERVSTADSVRGIFEFSEAKQHYYAGSSLIWLDGGPDAERAAREAAEAINLWTHEPVETRSLDDEALAHVYQGTAHLQLGQLDAATHAVRPILDLPAERQISWIRKRLARFAGMLRDEPYTGSHGRLTSTMRSRTWRPNAGQSDFVIHDEGPPHEEADLRGTIWRR
jgi:tetratricopeptide (TPR) repeat protein